ncbi:tRNA (adenosine(37)-N6)-threonylcarbamoyltransferase complex transferase subunit TsaD [Candidatus Bathyarchaeota archaeon]|nr:MAG: tRNA (adenosine(37)-N6)-threonylcarbamoyltransferase complex transferase subunit TsaD [Candidatus Bathyarchaeota archaeon]
MCLGIESTAHTFGASLVDDHDRIVTNVNSTYRPPVGVGIHPRKASEHLASVADSIVKTALSTQDGSSIDPDVIAYAAGPGLGPCLRIGATVGRALSSFLKKPLVAVHHGVAHLDIAMSIAKAHDPLAVLVSGGHTSILVHIGKRWRVYGETQDITLGNLLDMFAREAKLPSPGGLSVSKEAMKGEKLIKLPYTVKGNDVAYSGLLTAATSSLHRQGNLADLCFSLQETAFAMLSEAVERSLVQTRRSEVLLAGGVAASSRLREMIGSIAEDHGASFHPVPVEYSGDCGAQIACSGRLAFESGITVSTSDSFVIPRWRMDEVDVPWIPRN